MSLNHARHMSENPARRTRLQPDMAAASSPTRRFTHRSHVIIPGHYRERYRTGGHPACTAAGNIFLTSSEIHQLGDEHGKGLPDQEFLAPQVVRHGNKQNFPAIADPKGSIRNTYPYDTGTTCRQWRGRRRCGPRCGVSRG